jgi:hypothetical protein
MSNSNRTIRIEGTDYKVRYEYTKDDGTQWLVLLNFDESAPLYGTYNDEWPKSQVC